MPLLNYTRHGIPKSRPIGEELADSAAGYYACVSYVDAGGLMLDALEKAGRNTIVIVWGDHGWHLGDMDGAGHEL